MSKYLKNYLKACEAVHGDISVEQLIEQLTDALLIYKTNQISRGSARDTVIAYLKESSC